MNATRRTLMSCVAAVTVAAGYAQAGTAPANSLGSEPPGIKCFDVATRQPVPCTPSVTPPAAAPDQDRSPLPADPAKARLQSDGGPAAGALLTPAPATGPTRFDDAGAPLPAPAPQKSRENK
jgi:hypothetical protein